MLDGEVQLLSKDWRLAAYLISSYYGVRIEMLTE